MTAGAVRDFLLEIGVEEMPAAAAADAAAQAAPLARDSFAAHHIAIAPEQIKVWVTPRRIAIFIAGLPELQEDRELVDRGPVVDVAFDANGQPTKAAAGFAKGKGVKPEELEVREQDGRQFVFAVRQQTGAPVVSLLPEICGGILKGFSFPKTMHWDGAHIRFARPVRWLVTKFGTETLEFAAAGIQSGATSQGHRFLGMPQVEIAAADQYIGALGAAGVVVDQEERRSLILEGLAIEAGKLGARFIDPAGELEEVLYLVEHPSVQAGTFAEEHLRLPDRVLITAMQSHQRYFPLTGEDGSLVAGFLYVMNADPASAPGITRGNERVLEGRIEDAEFSFDQDLNVGIEEMAVRLGQVVFHSRLGSLAEKTARLEGLVAVLGEMLDIGETDLKSAASAARLAKADQVSVMVQEFSDLEGYMGSTYARMEGYTSEICTAIAEHYLPVSAGGEIPATVAGALLSIADKVDNLMGAFAVDELPSGSRDPYGLRRAAAGVAIISERYSFDIDLRELLMAAHRLLIEQKADVNRDAAVVTAALDFVFDRVQHRQVEAGTPVETMEAARAAAPASIIRLLELSQAIDNFRRQPAFEDLHTAYFRCSKIAAKAGGESGAIDPALFSENTEKELFEAVNSLQPQIDASITANDYTAAMQLAATIRPVVDRFFDEVMVMDKDEQVRRNRLALVTATARMLLGVGDPIRAAATPE